ncbi:MAG TPA: carboxypeptidase-like regulatory domain-containing protein [Bacteroidales bacterium]|nr:carboxypeptidase-like regulatory domain-containing protein [Bacteroidales bacterium]
MKRSNLKLALILAALLTAFTINVRAQDLNSATLLTRSEQYDKAAEMFQKLIQQDPANSKNYFFLGENYLVEYFADTISNSLAVAAKSAKEAYQKGVEANPNDPLNYIGLAKVAYYLGDDKTAVEMRAKAKSFLLPYKNLRKINPPAKDYAYTLAKIAESYINNGKVDTSLALPLIREAIKIDNKSRDIYLISGDIYILVNDGSTAIMYYNQAQFADPESPTASMKIGSIYVKGRALTPAIQNFEEAIALNAEYAPAYRELGQLYSSAGRFTQSKEYFEKYLELTKGNIPAKIRYITSLFYAKEYDEVIKNVEEIFTIDKSKTYMNRIAGYSAYEKTPPDYEEALRYMETLFKTVAPERILWKDYYYTARILLKKNPDYPKMIDELNSLNSQLDREKNRYDAASTSAEKVKIKASIVNLTSKVTASESNIAKADIEIDRAFEEYAKVLEYKPQDKNLLNEIAINYYNYRRYEGAARTWTKLIDPNDEDIEDYMRIARAYYSGEKFKTADSVLKIVIQKSQDYLPAYLLVARTYSKMDPDTKLGLAKPKFEKLIAIAKNDSLKNGSEMMEAFGYLSYFHMIKENYNKSKEYYNRMISLNASNKDNKIKGYNGIGLVETRIAGAEKTIEGRLAILSKAAAAYNKALAVDPTNSYAKNQLSYVRDFEAQVRKGINPNEIKGVIKNAAGQPVPYASVRVKDTAAENFTNASGEYKFEIPAGMEFLIISADGYKPKEVPITKSRIYNVTLEK